MLTNVSMAHTTAARLLADLPDRWAHTLSVARHSEEIAFVVGPMDRDVFLCAAWLHDIGYADPLRRTGWHCLDGGIHLREEGWPSRVASLVAHHCHAAVVAAPHGLADQLGVFPREDGVVADALVYAEMISGWSGARVTLQQRLQELERTSTPEGVTLQAARAQRSEQLRRSVERVEHHLQALGRGHAIT